MKTIHLGILFLLLSISVFSQENHLIIEQSPLIDSMIAKKRALNLEEIIDAETPRDICHPYPKNGLVPGYKIQLDRFKTKTEADMKAAQFSATYPSIHASVRYETPNYKVYVGNYFTAKTMESDLRKIRQNFKGAFSVRSKVYVDKKEWNKKYCPSKSKNSSQGKNTNDSIENKS